MQMLVRLNPPPENAIVNNPTGKSPKVCPAPRAKIFRFTRRANQ
jgi:hypothetical protein